MENYSFIVGIDVSKSKLDYSIISNTDTSSEVVHFISSNDKKGIKTAVKEIKSKVDCLQDVLFCFENTGVYSMPLNMNLSSLGLSYWVVAPIEISKSRGLVRGKSDKADSKDIAYYAKTHLHKLALSSLQEADILKIKILLSERNKLIKAFRALDTLKEYENNFPKEMIKDAFKINKKVIQQLKKSIKEVENKIEAIVAENHEIKKQSE